MYVYTKECANMNFYKLSLDRILTSVSVLHLLNIYIDTLNIQCYAIYSCFQVVLSACSSYFQKLLMENPCKHPTIIMPQDVCFSDLKFIIEFVYRGEIDVSQAELQVDLYLVAHIFYNTQILNLNYVFVVRVYLKLLIN